MYIIRGDAAQICQPSDKTSNKVSEISVPRYQKKSVLDLNFFAYMYLALLI